MALMYKRFTVIRPQGYIEYAHFVSTIFNRAPPETDLTIIFRYLIRQIMVSMFAVSGILLLVF
ncbi:hypothetical protein [Marinobacter sp.]|uniref:hypothetical protein n=1 Tax=Marinobacter sp. TaxID=50741 RepID=UPI003A90F1A4